MAKIIDLDIQLPLIVRKPNPIIVPKPTLISRGVSSIEVEQTFQCDVDYYGGVGIEQYGAVDAKLVKNPNTMTATLTGLMQNTEYTIKGVGLPILGNETIGEGLVVMTKASPIPDEYQLVEYLESDGSGQYIDTLYIPQVDSEIIAKMAITSTSGQNVSGITYGSSAGWFNFGYVPGLDPNKLLLSWFTTNTSISGPYVDLDFHIYERTNSYQKIDGVTYSNISLTSVPSSLSFYLFYVHVNYVPLPNVATYKQKFAYFKIRIAGEEIKSMYPVYRKADSKPGMYDIVNGVFTQIKVLGNSSLVRTRNGMNKVILFENGKI